VAILGPEETSSARLNLSQGFNSFGTTIGPILGGFFIFEYFGGTNAHGASSVIVPYLFLTGVLVLLAVLIWSAKLPRFYNKDFPEKGAGAWQFMHLRLGALAIFVYVGAEVAIGSILINYLGLENIAGLSEADASPYVAFYWGGAMIGRFLGAIALSNIDKMTKIIGMIGIAIGAFLVVYGAIYLKNGIAFHQVAPFLIFVALNLVAFTIGKSMPGRSLMVFALVPVILLLTTISTHGLVAMWAVLGIGIFNSIMWSNIFTLAIMGLGDHKSQGSSVLVMAIVGGAIIPPIQGAVADWSGIQFSFIVPIICYLYLAYYGWKGHVIKKLA